LLNLKAIFKNGSLVTAKYQQNELYAVCTRHFLINVTKVQQAQGATS